jgi:hypothetical protein
MRMQKRHACTDDLCSTECLTTRKRAYVIMHGISQKRKENYHRHVNTQTGLLPGSTTLPLPICPTARTRDVFSTEERKDTVNEREKGTTKEIDERNYQIEGVSVRGGTSGRMPLTGLNANWLLYHSCSLPGLV